jgi:hypothetical protein
MNTRCWAKIVRLALIVVSAGLFSRAAGAGTFPAVVDLTTLDGTNGFKIIGVSISDATGTSVSSAGDFNGDGIADLLIGAPRLQINGADSGSAYVVYGRPGGFPDALHLAKLTAHIGTRLDGVPGASAGGAVANAGDVNGDDVSDIVIGGGANPSTIGTAYVVFGKAGFPVEFELSRVNGKNGFQFSDSDSAIFRGWFRGRQS